MEVKHESESRRIKVRKLLAAINRVKVSFDPRHGSFHKEFAVIKSEINYFTVHKFYHA